MSEQNCVEPMVLVFDWGDTLMKVFPQYAGAMFDWPEVEAVAGAEKALQYFLGRSQMVVATNAGDSGAPQVQQALERVGLSIYFRAVFTSSELGSRKPETLFYRQIESVLARPPHEMVMIGDNYSVDMLGAKAAGWRAAWYNPAGETAPGSLPLHDIEVESLEDLPQALCQRRLPDYQVCLTWLNSRGTPLNLLTHIQLVASVAYTLAVWLRWKGEAVDPILAHRGGLLHDLAKFDSIQNRRNGTAEKEDHAAAGAAMLLAYGQPELAEIALRHMPHEHADDPRRPLTWEQKLVHFADKLAEGARLVSLDERFLALKRRYPQYASQMDASRPHLDELEQQICARLETSPRGLLEELRRQTGM
jgi:putative hydrolase of the HAD superfamily